MKLNKQIQDTKFNQQFKLNNKNAQININQFEDDSFIISAGITENKAF